MFGSRSITTPQAGFIPEPGEQFLKLWPWRHDFIYAAHPKPEASPLWKTEDRYPLSDRAILRGDQLLGVRFGAETSYAMLDIDRESIYHPRRDRFAVGKMMDALEELGITDRVSVSSSHRGGCHIYFPLSAPVLTWQLATVLQRCLLRAGFYVGKGILEIFPNARGYDSDPDQQSCYLAHRLPLQPGSYLINEEWNFIHSDRAEFCKQWAFCKARNEINKPLFNLRLKESSERRHRLSYKAKKFLNDLNGEIDPGWTGPGQTNHILGRIAMREYIFGHLHRKCDPLEGDNLSAAIADTAIKLPGYGEWCRHQPEIWERAEQWARAIERSHYRHYNTDPPGRGGDESGQGGGVSWNQWQQTRARERITFAIADMLNRDSLPAATRERFEALTKNYAFSGETLYSHRDLWHPDHLWKSPPAPPMEIEESGLGAQGGHVARQGCKLIEPIGRNTLLGNDSEAFGAIPFGAIGGNSTASEDHSHLPPPNGGGGGGG